MNIQEFNRKKLKLIYGEFIDDGKNAFDALLAYEINCMKYESQLPKHLEHLAKIPHNERMEDFALKFNTTITEISPWYSNFYLVRVSRNFTQTTSGTNSLTVTKQYALTNTSTIFFQKTSWESVGATQGSEVSDTLFPANARVSVVTLNTYFGTQYYRVTFSQTSSSTAITAGSTTITFKFGQPPYALPGETIFSFIAAPGTAGALDLSELKELTSSTLGGRGTYPNGPDVLAINVFKSSGTAIPSNIVLRWGEAQA